jgi:cation transport ATPase
MPQNDVLLAQQEKEISRHFYRLVLGILTTALLLAKWVAGAMGFYLFFFEDAKIQFVWGTIALVGLGSTLGLSAYRTLRKGGVSLLSVGLLVAVAAYGYSLFLTFANTQGTALISHVYYDVTAGILTLLMLGKLRSTITKKQE